MIQVALDVRKINQAIEKNLFSRGGGVYCQLADGSLHRICKAKTVQGQLLVRRVGDGLWLSPWAVSKEY